MSLSDSGLVRSNIREKRLASDYKSVLMLLKSQPYVPDYMKLGMGCRGFFIFFRTRSGKKYRLADVSVMDLHFAIDLYFKLIRRLELQYMKTLG